MYVDMGEVGGNVQVVSQESMTLERFVVSSFPGPIRARVIARERSRRRGLEIAGSKLAPRDHPPPPPPPLISPSSPLARWYHFLLHCWIRLGGSSYSLPTKGLLMV
jgi:hypothetical protein